MSWQPPKEHETRPVAILGAGVLGRRIGMSLSAVHSLERIINRFQHVPGQLLGLMFTSVTQARSSAPNVYNTSMRTSQRT